MWNPDVMEQMHDFAKLFQVFLAILVLPEIGQVTVPALHSPPPKENLKTADSSICGSKHGHVTEIERINV